MRFVAFSINGVDEGTKPEDLKRAMSQLGIDDQRWWFLTTGDTKKQRGYIKDQLRLGLVSERSAGDQAGKFMVAERKDWFSVSSAMKYLLNALLCAALLLLSGCIDGDDPNLQNIPVSVQFAYSSAILSIAHW